MATSWNNYGSSSSAQGPSDQPPRSSSAEQSSKKPQSRQLLSCTKCRERKVKCDRTKPCSACCARGHPRECEFVVGEGNDYSPIQQSYEIRKLRAENQRLKERLQAARLPHSGDEDDDDIKEPGGSKAAAKAIASRQRRFKTGDRTDNLYFGTPGLANIVSDFASLSMGTQSLTHTMPKLARDMYAPEKSMYPFHIMFPNSHDSASLVHVLPQRDKLFKILDMFQCRAQSCYFPHTPDELTKKEVERFLSDPEANATRAPDMLALIFATLATGLQMGQCEMNGGQWIAGAVEATRRESDVFLAASMQALRQASFMSQPTLLGIQTLVMIGPYLTNSGRFLDAWTLFGTTIRMAHSMGLHRNPKFLEPAPPLRECMIRQTLWWWMLHMDQQYAVTLGRPLGISGLGDCPPPEPLITNPTRLRLCEFVDHFTLLARQILSSDGLMHVAKIDEFTDKLLGLWDTMPESLQFNESWVRPETVLPEWPLEVMSATLFAKVQSFLVLLNRQRVERTQGTAGEGSPTSSMAPPPRSTGSYHLGGAEPFLHPAPVRGRSLVINSCLSLLSTFMFFFHRNSAVLVCWTIGQQAFNACMILLLDAWETENQQNEWLVNQAYGVFVILEQNGVHSLAQLAVARISDGLAQLETRRLQRQAAMSRRSSDQYQPTLTIDTASMKDWSGDTVMGNTGMYLLEDPGLQSYVPQSFQPLAWNMAGSSHSHFSSPPSPGAQTPTSSVSQVTVAAPFPVMTSPFTHGNMQLGGSAGLPYTVDVQPRMSQMQQRRRPSSRHENLPLQPMAQDQQSFTPVNTHQPIQHPLHSSQHQQARLQSFSQVRGPRRSSHSHRSASSAGVGPREAHRLERPPRSQQRRK